MTYQVLPGTDLTVSRIVMGCEPLGGTDWGEFDIEEAKTAVHAALDAGITTFDTSDIYGIGDSERNLGEALGSRRDEAVIVTKFGLTPHVPPGGGRASVTKDASPARVVEALEASLGRLGVEAIPLYLLHYPDPKTPYEDTVAALLKCRDAGKIRFFGVSNFSGPLLADACTGTCPSVIQMEYSLIKRDIEADILPTALANGVSGMVYGPLAQGLLTGKYGPDSKFDQSDRRWRLPHFSPEGWAKTAGILQALKDAAETTGRPASEVAIAWALRHPAVAMAIVGVKNAQQAERNALAADLDLSEETYRALNEAAANPTITA